MKTMELEKKGSLTRKLLRLFKPSNLQESISLQENNVSCIPKNIYYDYQKEIETAMLEAERKKAKALMEWQKRNFIC